MYTFPLGIGRKLTVTPSAAKSPVDKKMWYLSNISIEVFLLHERLRVPWLPNTDEG